MSAPADANYSLIVTATFEASGASGGDWGSAYFARCFITQNGSTSYGDSIPLSTTRLPYAVQYVFSPSTGFTIDCGLYGLISGAVSATFNNIKVHAELIKR